MTYVTDDGKDWRDLPAARGYHTSAYLGYNARNIVVKTASGNMNQSLILKLLKMFKEDLT